MRVAIIGSGISGLVAAARLHPRCGVTVFEANDYIGGHTHTVDVEWAGERHAIDTGFIVYNEHNYPQFTRLLAELGVATQPTSMSFSVHDERDGLEYCGSNLWTLFAQRRNLWRPGFLRMLWEILDFNRRARCLAERLRRPSPAGEFVGEPPGDAVTVGEFLERHRYSRRFAEQYLLPMGSAIWSCPMGRFAEFPLRFVVEFFHNHGLLTVRGRPTWRVISGGSRTYVAALTAPFRHRIRLRTPVERVFRSPEGVVVVPRNQPPEMFDHVVFACHSDQALQILAGDATPVERAVLSAFPYQRNVAVLHTDPSLLPRRKRAWASWNYRVAAAGKDSPEATVTYNMNLLQGLRSRHTFCVTLNAEERIAPERILRRFIYHHPVFRKERSAAQARQRELLDANGVSFCGAYWGSGFHEDGVNSALAVVAALNRRLEAPRDHAVAGRPFVGAAS